MTTSYQVFERMYRNGDSKHNNTWRKIGRKLNTTSHPKINLKYNPIKVYYDREDLDKFFQYKFTVIDEDTIKITSASNNERSVTAKGFFLFRLVEHKDRYDLFLDLDLKKRVKTKLDEISELITYGYEKVWGIQHPENKKDWGLSWYKKDLDSDGIHKMIFHFILPLIHKVKKYKGYLHFSSKEKGLYMTDYFIITKLS
jgi:hypothetical protein